MQFSQKLCSFLGRQLRFKAYFMQFYGTFMQIYGYFYVVLWYIYVVLRLLICIFRPHSSIFWHSLPPPLPHLSLASACSAKGLQATQLADFPCTSLSLACSPKALQAELHQENELRRSRLEQKINGNNRKDTLKSRQTDGKTT